MSALASGIGSDLIHDIRRSPAVLCAAATMAIGAAACLAAPLLAPQDPFDPAALDLLNSHLPPAWQDGGSAAFPLGADKQGRDVLSAILYGARISLAVGIGAVAVSALIGVALGLVAGFTGGRIDSTIMRVAEVQFAFPPILLALLLNGMLRVFAGPEAFASAAVWVLVLAIGVAGWVQYARVVRASAQVERNKEYVLACRVAGFGRFYTLRRHVLPNVLGPVLVLAMTQIAVAIIYEATLSFLGLGTPATMPSLGALIQNGAQYLFSGIWWVVAFPGFALLLMVLALTIVGDWIRDYMNPRLR